MSQAPIKLYTLATPNGQKISIALEEMKLPYEAICVNIGKGDQFTEEFVSVNPNSKIPAIVDPNGPGGEPINIMESGAILLYLAEKAGKFLSEDPRLRNQTMQWLFFQMAGVGPMFGQFGHFYKYGGKQNCDHPYPITRYSNEAKRLLGVLNKRLEERDFLIEDGYSIADMATFPWVGCLINIYNAREHLGLDDYPHVMDWYDRCMKRPAAVKGAQVCPMNK